MPKLPWPLRLLPAHVSGARTLTSRARTLFSCVLRAIRSRVCVLRCCRYQGAVEEGEAITSRTLVRFTWYVSAPGLREAQDVELRCVNAVDKGVPTPKGWRSKLGWRIGTPAVDEFAEKACKRARTELALSEDAKLDCRRHHPETCAYDADVSCMLHCVRICVEVHRGQGRSIDVE